jgi:hypothetical protein
MLPDPLNALAVAAELSFDDAVIMDLHPTEHRLSAARTGVAR